MTTAFQSAPFILNPQQAKQTAPMCGSIKAQGSEDHTVTHLQARNQLEIARRRRVF